MNNYSSYWLLDFPSFSHVVCMTYSVLLQLQKTHKLGQNLRDYDMKGLMLFI